LNSSLSIVICEQNSPSCVVSIKIRPLTITPTFVQQIIHKCNNVYRSSSVVHNVDKQLIIICLSELPMVPHTSDGPSYLHCMK
jgi:hypothetical protein